MRGLFVTAPGKLEIKELPIPVPGPYEALVKTEACAICNSTDTKVLHGQFVSGTYPILLGHETVGKIINLGPKVRNYKIGDRVLRGTLADSQIPFPGGRSCWGGFVEYNLVTDQWAKDNIPYNTGSLPQQIVPASISPELATMLITLKENLSVITNLEVSGKLLAVIGTGPVAQAMVLFSKLLGAKKVTVFGRSATWEEPIRRLGADDYIIGENLTNDVKKILNEGGFDRVTEAVGSRQALSLGVKLAGSRGKVGIYGIPPENEPYLEKDVKNPVVFYPKVAEGDVHTKLLEMIQAGKVTLEAWVSLVLPWEEFEIGFNKVWKKEANKVVLRFD
jgi:threonine dehydrogenase-like Zn-dependent dehydrogenase